MLLLTRREGVISDAVGVSFLSIRGALSQKIAMLLGHTYDNKIAFERLVIEPMDLADPGPILQMLLIDPVLLQSVPMDGVVTVVDVLNGAAMADLLMLS